jgi:heme/copper-type cytochrome/quinol oxidase subunit 2
LKILSVGLVGVTSFVFGFFVVLIPLASAQSPQVAREWALFNQILMIGIVVGIVVFGLMFYAIVKYRDRPQRAGAQ